MVLWVLFACVPPSVMGLGFDPLVPRAGQAELALAGGGGGLLPRGESEALGAAGAELRLGAGSGLAVSAGGAWVQGGVWSARGDVEGTLLHEDRAPLDLCVHGGLSTLCDAGSSGGGCLLGGQVGLGAAFPLLVGLRPFVRVQLNPVVARDPAGDPRVSPFLVSSLGVSWRPPLAEGAHGFFAVRVDEIHSFAAPRSEVAEDVDGIAVLGEVGLRFGRVGPSPPRTSVPLPDLPADAHAPPTHLLVPPRAP